MGILGAVEHLLVRFPDTHVLLLGIFPRGTGPQDKLRQHNDRINAILAQCKLPRTTYANINRRFLDSSGKLLPGISRDNLHFTEKGYAIWADAVLPYIKNTANSFLSHPQRMTVGMPPSASHAYGSGTYLSINDEAYAARTVQPSFLKLQSWSLKSTAHVHQFIFPGGSALNAYE